MAELKKELKEFNYMIYPYRNQIKVKKVYRYINNPFGLRYYSINGKHISSNGCKIFVDKEEDIDQAIKSMIKNLDELHELYSKYTNMTYEVNTY